MGRRYRMDRINPVAMLEQLIHRRSLVGFDRYRQLLKAGALFTKLFPAFYRMLKLEVANNLALLVHDHHDVMIPRPVKAGVMSNLFPLFHLFSFLALHRGAVINQPDTVSLAGSCSLRLQDRRRWTGRCAPENLRKVRDTGP